MSETAHEPTGYALKDAIEDYLAERRNRGFSCERTHRWMLRRLLVAARARLEREPLAIDITREDLDEVLAEGLSRGHASSTQFQTATLLRLLCQWLFRKGVLLLDPSVGFIVKKPETPLLFVPSRQQVRRLLDVAQPERALARESENSSAFQGDVALSRRERVLAESLRDKAALELLYGSGLRYSELAHLDVNDVNLAERSLLVRSGKGKKDRAVPITRASARALSRYLSQGRPTLVSQHTAAPAWAYRRRLPQHAALFVTVSGARLSQAWRSAFFKPLALLAGLPPSFTPHRLRHACALHLLESGAGIVAIGRLLGHNSIGATAIYLRLDVAALRKTLLLAHPLEKTRGTGAADLR